MAGLETPGSNPDVSLLYDINGLTRSTPGWLDHTVQFLGAYGLLIAMAAVLVACWWSERRRAVPLEAAASSAAALIWAPLGAAIAVLVNMPIRGFVGRPRPFVDHDGIDVLVPGGNGFSFVSDHATFTMALAVGLSVINRKFGLLGIVVALAEGFCRIFTGEHYPTDVVGGFALGTAVTLLLSPPATAVLTPLTKAIARSRHAGWMIRSRRYPVAVATESASVPGQDAAGLDTPGREVHERRQEQYAEPTRYGRHQVPLDPAAQERRGRRVREPRESHETSQDRDEAGWRPSADAAARTGGRQDPPEPATSRGESEPRDPHGPEDPHGPRTPQGPREPDLAA
jgi:undecaprenyl-diphosphatase